MSYQEIYPVDLSAHDVAAGFQRVLIQNESHDSLYAPNLVVVVVYVLSPFARIEKMGGPGLGISYAHRQFGECRGSPESEWSPVGSYGTPAAAIAAATSGFDDQVVKRIGHDVDQSFPSLVMHCAECGNTYELRKAQLIPHESVTCPSCRDTRPAREGVTFEQAPGVFRWMTQVQELILTNDVYSWELLTERLDWVGTGPPRHTELIIRGMKMACATA
jgi:hypothetical protein